MKTTLFKNLIVLLVVGMSLGACKKEAGPIGPQGPKGDTGAAGAAGATGPAGAAGAKGDTGAAGTANVIYSDWLAIPETPSAKGSNYKEYRISTPKITQEIFNNGTVYAYARSGSSASTFPLPNSINTPYISQLRIIVGVIYYGEWWMVGTVNSTWLSNNKTDYFTHIRYVIIPGGVKAAAVDFNNYESVKAHYQLGE